MVDTVSKITGLGDHTVVIPTYNRPELLGKLVRYYAEWAPDVNILILDSSQGDTPARNAELMALAPARTRHVVFPSTMPPGEKLAKGILGVTTGTASLCADDDVVFPVGLLQAAKFVAIDRSYVCAHGVYVNFGEYPEKVRVSLEYAGPSNEAGHPGARIFAVCQNYESLYYGVFRSVDLKEILGETAKLPTLHYQELIQTMVALVKGKVKRFNEFYGGRRSGPAAEPERTNWQTYYWFAENPAEFLSHYLQYREHLRAYYDTATADRQQDTVSRADFDRIVDISHAMYFARNCPPYYLWETLQPLWPRDQYVGGKAPVLPKSRFIAWVETRYEALTRPRDGRTPEGLLAAYLWAQGITRPGIRRFRRNVAERYPARFTPEFAPGWEWLAENRWFHYGYYELLAYLQAPG